MPNAARILLVDDEPGLVRTISDRLRADGYEVEAALTGPEGLRHAMSGRFELVVLDVMLPGLDGNRVLSQLRAEGVRTPVLLLTARSLVEQKVAALKEGADDYLTKPFRLDELAARIEALLRRTRGAPFVAQARRLTFGPFILDVEREELTRDGEVVPLTDTEFMLLAYLSRHHGRAISREELLREAWRYDPPSTTSRTVDQHIAQLRRKIGLDPSGALRIVTVHGRGYLVR